MKKQDEVYFDGIGRLVQFVGFWPDGEEKEIVLREADGSCASCGMIPPEERAPEERAKDISLYYWNTKDRIREVALKHIREAEQASRTATIAECVRVAKKEGGDFLTSEWGEGWNAACQEIAQKLKELK